MDTFLIKAVQLILALAILVIIHEFGHFLFARMFGIRVEKFYIFFNPVTSLFKWRPKRYTGALHQKWFKSSEAEKNSEAEDVFNEASKDYYKLQARYTEEFGEKSKFQKFMMKLFPPKTLSAEEKTELKRDYEVAAKRYGEECVKKAERDRVEYEVEKKERGPKRFWSHTEYGVGWLPLGGYCKIAGMIDESMDTEQMKQPAQEWEFRSRPAWQRLLVMIAGVLFNFLLAILIYAGIVYTTGERYVPYSEAKMGMEYSGEARKAGFHNGDIPLRADGQPLENPYEDRMTMIQAKTVTVLRDGKEVDITIPEKFIFALDNEAKSDTAVINFMSYRIPTRITQVVAGEGAAKAGIEVGDEVLAIDSVATPSLTDFLTTLQGHENRTVALTITRQNGEQRDTLVKNVNLSSASKMGVGLEVNPAAFYNYKEKTYSLIESVPRGIEMGTDRLVSYVKSMGLVFSKEGAKSIGGFGAIGSIFPEKWDWIAFWNIAAFLSVALAFMNILPIPALDGGHVLFLLYEVIFRRKPSEKFMENAQMAGMIFLILLLLYANLMDIVRLFL